MTIDIDAWVCPVPGCNEQLKNDKNLERRIAKHESTPKHKRALERVQLYQRILAGNVPPMQGTRPTSIPPGK